MARDEGRPKRLEKPGKGDPDSWELFEMVVPRSECPELELVVMLLLAGLSQMAWFPDRQWNGVGDDQNGSRARTKLWNLASRVGTNNPILGCCGSALPWQPDTSTGRETV
ncbi:hypothetical protein VTJ04DRAFT_1127 [Mycothermus thermophilus]|uniref:uncharacterized protein n=1 Tax=Humicola insolens TaxID=85995 RepID=UPI003743FC70